jgi:putative transposase
MPHYPRHLATVDYRGFRRYFLTFCTFERNAYFVDRDRVAVVGTQILRASRETDLAVIAYCYMPDHLHLLVEGTREDADLKDFVKRAKQYSGFYFRHATRNSLWQRYGFERVVRDDEATATIVRYIIENSVRAGLVTDIRDYPYWGSELYTREALIDFAYEPPKGGPH